jgi:uncharacterized protein YabE (DUF348 family)
MSKIKILIISSIAVLAMCAGGFFLYSSQLEKSKNEGKNIVSRAIPQDQILKNGDIKSNQTIGANSGELVNQKVIKTGQFVYLDPAHYAKGNVTLIESGDNVKIAFSEDFETNPDGPDLYIWLAKKQDIKNSAIGGVSSKTGDYLDLGPIQSKSGSQAYQISKSELVGNDYAIVIWCRAFGIQFSNAILT